MTEQPSTPGSPAPSGLRGLLQQQPWVALVVPFLVYMLVGGLEPSPSQDGGTALGFAIPYSAYPLLYTLKIGLTIVAIAIVSPGYPALTRRPSLLALTLGVVGVFVWVGLWQISRDFKILETLGLGRLIELGERPGYNPFDQLSSSPAVAWAFLSVRFFGLVVVVPVIEELFLRGFAMRFVMSQDWWKIPIGQVNRSAVAVGILLPALTHPAAEWLPAIAWFAMGTWLLVKTRNLWDCVLMHAVTNLLLGIYVVSRGQWDLW